MSTNGSLLITLVRQPRAHVLSQYMHCTTAGYHKHEDVLPRYDDWIKLWLPYREGNKALPKGTVLKRSCYDPRNLQTSRFTCYPKFRSKSPDLREAIDNVNSAAFVGLVEAYEESLCVVFARVRGSLPEWCRCGTVDSKQNVTFHKNDHGVKPHSVTDYNQTVQGWVDELTRLDCALYKAARERFLRDIWLVESRFKTTILCRKLRPNPSAGEC